jgi:replication-associated recombination protein RarA
MYEIRKTKNGYEFFEVASAFQKSVRRGLLDDAIYWAVELVESGNSEYLWKRIFIIVSEDIGIAEPTMPATIEALYQQFLRQAKKTKASKDKNEPERLFIVHAVVAIVRAKKSRLVDWLLIYHFSEHSNIRKLVPDYAIDKHTQRGRSLKRGFKHFFEEGSKLANHYPDNFEYEAMERTRKMIEESRKGDNELF